ncbi:MAG: hypothetical protein K2P30_03515, partial [Lachnospiraceae bacterium]|nr:hypothetical protein [Lachnospiraceae bacterium]
MKNSRIFALALCGICLLGGCGSRNGEEREKEAAVLAVAENTQEDFHKTDGTANSTNGTANSADST